MKPSALLPDNKILYDEDFHLWTQQTAELLRAGQFDVIDIEQCSARAIPSIRRFLPQNLEKTYGSAVEDAVNEMGLLKNPFPERCPLPLDQILDSKFLPEE